MSPALEHARTHLADLREELAAAHAVGLMDHPAYQADLQEEMAIAEAAYSPPPSPRSPPSARSSAAPAAASAPQAGSSRGTSASWRCVPPRTTASSTGGRSSRR